MFHGAGAADVTVLPASFQLSHHPGCGMLSTGRCLQQHCSLIGREQAGPKPSSSNSRASAHIRIHLLLLAPYFLP